MTNPRIRVTALAPCRGIGLPNHSWALRKNPLHRLDPTCQEGEIEAALVPLADAGYAVTVVAPDEGVDKHLGWRLSLDAPGLHTSFRVPTDADPIAWAAAVARAPRRSS